MLRKVDLDVSLLRTFVTGVQMGNFTHAADRLGRSQSTVSLQLRRLEGLVGSKLFEKQGRTLVLNNQGEVLYTYAQRLLELNDEAVSAVSKQELSGEVRLGMPPDLAESWLPKMLGRFSRTYPEVLIEARVDRNRSLLDDLSSNALDIAIVWNDGKSLEPLGGTDVIDLPISWIGGKDFRIEVDQPIPLVLMAAPCLFRQRAIEMLEAGGQPWRIAFTSSSLAGVWAAVSAGLGVTVRTPIGMPPELEVLANVYGKGTASKTLGRIKLRAHASSASSEGASRFFDILMDTIDAELREPKRILDEARKK